MKIEKTTVKDLLYLMLLLSFFYGFFLGSRPLNAPDEARYTEIPREMIATGDYTTPRLNGVIYFEKPPLFYWMQTVSLRTFGQSLGSARFMNALMGMLGVLTTFVFSRRLFNRKTAWLAASIQLFSPLYFCMAHMVTLDMTLSFFLNLSLFSLITALQKPPSREKRLALYTAYVASGFAVLTKGLVGLIFPGTIAVLWILCNQQWKALKNLYLISGLFLFALIVIPWHWRVTVLHPDFFRFYILDQQFLRYFTRIAHRYQPAWYFIPILLAGFFPWILYLPSSVRASIKNPLLNYFMLWALVIFGFYSFSQSKLIPYILPVIAPLSVIVAVYLEANTSIKKIKMSLGVAIVLCITLLTILTLKTPSSIYTIGQYLQPKLQPEDIVISYDHYYQDLPVYLKRTVWIIDWLNELRYGTEQETIPWMMDKPSFWAQWDTLRASKRVYLVTSPDSYQQIPEKEKNTLYLILQTPDNLLLSNQVP